MPIPPQKPAKSDLHRSRREPQAYESDLRRHDDDDDEIYGSHGVQDERAPVPPSVKGDHKQARR